MSTIPLPDEPYVRRFDHVGITVAYLDTVTAFFEMLGLEAGNRMSGDRRVRGRLADGLRPGSRRDHRLPGRAHGVGTRTAITAASRSGDLAVATDRPGRSD
jgi:hypothetical protein